MSKCACLTYSWCEPAVSVVLYQPPLLAGCTARRFPVDDFSDTRSRAGHSTAARGPHRDARSRAAGGGSKARTIRGRTAARPSSTAADAPRL